MAKVTLTYKKKGENICIIGYFIEPDLEVIGKKYQDRIGNIQQKTEVKAVTEEGAV